MDVDPNTLTERDCVDTMQELRAIAKLVATHHHMKLLFPAYEFPLFCLGANAVRNLCTVANPAAPAAPAAHANPAAAAIALLTAAAVQAPLPGPEPPMGVVASNLGCYMWSLFSGGMTLGKAAHEASRDLTNRPNNSLYTDHGFVVNNQFMLDRDFSQIAADVLLLLQTCLRNYTQGPQKAMGPSGKTPCIVTRNGKNSYNDLAAAGHAVAARNTEPTGDQVPHGASPGDGMHLDDVRAIVFIICGPSYVFTGVEYLEPKHEEVREAMMHFDACFQELDWTSPAAIVLAIASYRARTPFVDTILTHTLEIARIYLTSPPP